ncbi:hypothetical protein G9A89_015329 [Geosiphon pyriformis]|nr:hypothetical protein G9A89_015329 [Geosiphon pyriformis]
MQQQPLQQPPQQLNVNQMAYAPITKLENFTSKEDDTQAWINDVFKAIIANNWDDTRALQMIPYFLKETANFCNNNSINCLANTFTTIKQNNTETVTTYLGRFYRILCQIQAIDAVYFTEPQIFNQFIRGLRSSILQHICPLHPANLQAAVTHARNFKSAELKANYAQVNYLSLLVTPEDTTTNNLGSNQQQALTNNIPPATVTNDKSLAAIFLFNLEKTIKILLFSRAALEEKPITIMYTDAKINGHAIKLILDSGLAGSIITKQLMDQLGHQVD